MTFDYVRSGLNPKLGADMVEQFLGKEERGLVVVLKELPDKCFGGREGGRVSDPCVIFSTFDAQPTLRHWQFALRPLLFLERCAQDLDERFSDHRIEVGKEVGEAGGQGGAQCEHDLWECNAGAQQDKLQVWLLKVGKEVGYGPDFGHLVFQSLPSESRVADWCPQEGHAKVMNPGDAPLEGVITSDKKEWAPHLGFWDRAGVGSGKVEASGRAFFNQDVNYLLEFIYIPDLAAVVVEPAIELESGDSLLDEVYKRLEDKSK